MIDTQFWEPSRDILHKSPVGRDRASIKQTTLRERINTRANGDNPSNPMGMDSEPVRYLSVRLACAQRQPAWNNNRIDVTSSKKCIFCFENNARFGGKGFTVHADNPCLVARLGFSVRGIHASRGEGFEWTREIQKRYAVEAQNANTLRCSLARECDNFHRGADTAGLSVKSEPSRIGSSKPNPAAKNLSTQFNAILLSETAQKNYATSLQHLLADFASAAVALLTRLVVASRDNARGEWSLLLY